MNDLTIESCVELAEKFGGVSKLLDGTSVASFSGNELLDYSQALTAKLREEIAKAAILNQSLVDDVKALKEQLAGCQEMLRQKDEALRDAIPFIGYGQSVPHIVEKAEQALALTSPTAALEAVRAEDKKNVKQFERDWWEACDQNHELNKQVEQLSASKARMEQIVGTNIAEFHADKLRAEDAIKNIECALFTYDTAWLEADRAEVPVLPPDTAELVRENEELRRRLAELQHIIDYE